MAQPPVADRASQYQGKTEKVTHVPQIIGLLRRIRDQRVLLSVRIPGHDAVFNSLLLEVDPERNFILLDELNPRAGHELAGQVRELRVHCQCQGVELGFHCKIEVGQGQSGISYYRATLPEYINYLQRRGNYRVRVGMSMSVPVHLPLEAAPTQLEGQLFDLSMSGLGANLGLQTKLTRGQIIESCSIHLPKEESLQVELEIRFVRIDEQHHSQRIGASFRNLEAQQSNRLRRFVTQLEREMLRRKARS